MKPLSLFLIGATALSCSHQRDIHESAEGRPLTVIAIGDAGEPGSVLRDNAKLVDNMYSGRHSAGLPDAMFFLGDNFYPTGLNVPADEVDKKIKKTLGPFRETFEFLGKENVHAVAGNHDYYARNAIEKSLLFGLIDISAGPVGLSDRGNQRASEIEWWTYHRNMPAEVVYPSRRGGQDSVQFIIFDSALPLRTDISTWKPALDSLRRMLATSATRPGIVWRILIQHHPWYSVGDHGGYSVWDDEENAITYLSNCDKDSNAVRWFMNTIDPEDVCAEKYQAMLNALRSVILAGGVKIHLTLTGHDHTLQLLSYPDDGSCSSCPKVHVVSGAGSEMKQVKSPLPPREFTASQRDKKGESRGGFAQLRFENDRLRIVFFDGQNGQMIDMGGGKREFWIDKEGRLLP
ncbi:MAG: metallophosphoesterase [Bacteroidetes bacterium]|nr:metallophosphoesterase [Bacteroidota bacterium]MCW5895247.1 metallophosphoesterase [Bacteroidota bacterium]